MQTHFFKVKNVDNKFHFDLQHKIKTSNHYELYKCNQETVDILEQEGLLIFFLDALDMSDILSLLLGKLFDKSLFLLYLFFLRA